MTLFRDFDGKTVRVERSGPTAAAAQRRLREHLRDRTAGPSGKDEITGESRVKELAEAWWTEFVALDIKRAPTSKVHPRLLALPGWGVDLFQRRWDSREPSRCDYDPVYMSSVGILKDPDNAHSQLRAAFDLLGYPWLVPHHLRKTAGQAG